MIHPRPGSGQPAPQHHPSIETLGAYCSGNIRAGFDVVVAAHLQGCPVCRADIAGLESLGGHLLSQLEPAALGKNALAATLARLDQPASRPSSPAGGGLDHLLGNAKRRWLAPGVWSAKINTPHDRADRVFLLRVAPGGKTAKHTHAGAEFTQVLEGALDDDGVIYRAGDFVELGADHTHHPRVHGDQPCLCLFATEGRLVPIDLVGRIAFAVANV